jgi:hypothetical protein
MAFIDELRALNAEYRAWEMQQAQGVWEDLKVYMREVARQGDRQVDMDELSPAGNLLANWIQYKDAIATIARSEHFELNPDETIIYW